MRPLTRDLVFLVALHALLIARCEGNAMLDPDDVIDDADGVADAWQKLQANKQ